MTNVTTFDQLPLGAPTAADIIPCLRAGVDSALNPAGIASLISQTVFPSGDTTGATDTANIQVLLSAFAPVGGVYPTGSITLAPGNWYLNATLTVPQSFGWRMWGSGMWNTVITMVPNNTPFFNFNGGFTGWWDVGYMSFQYKNTQTLAANPLSIVFYFTSGGGNGIYNWTVHHCYFGNVVRAFSTPASGAGLPAVWGYTVEHCWFSTVMTGAVAWLNAPPTAQPSCVWRDCYVNCGTSGGATAGTAIEPAFTISQANLLFEQVEFNSGQGYSTSLPQMSLSSCASVNIFHCRTEQTGIQGGSNAFLWNFPDSTVEVDSTSFATITVYTGTGSYATMLAANTSGAISLRNVSANANTASLKILLVSATQIGSCQSISLAGLLLTVNGLVGGTGGTTGTYTNVPLVASGTGSGITGGATATITVAGGAVTSVVVNTGASAGVNYFMGEPLSAASANIGNVTGFSCQVATINAYLRYSDASGIHNSGIDPAQVIDSQTSDTTYPNPTTTGTVTMTAGYDRVQLVSNTLTGNLTFNLPTTGYSDSAEFIFIRKAGTPGAFTLTVTDPTSGNSQVLPSNTNGCQIWRATSQTRWDCINLDTYT